MVLTYIFGERCLLSNGDPGGVKNIGVAGVASQIPKLLRVPTPILIACEMGVEGHALSFTSNCRVHPG